MTMGAYSMRLREQMVRRLTAPGAPTAGELSREVGISAATLSGWVRNWGTMADMSKREKRTNVTYWTPQEKLQAVVETLGMSQEEIGRYVREKGLHRARLVQWKEQMLGGLAADGARTGPKPSGSLGKRVRELEKALRRRKGALAGYRGLADSRKKQLLHGFLTARGEATRQRRLEAILREAQWTLARARG